MGVVIVKYIYIFKKKKKKKKVSSHVHNGLRWRITMKPVQAIKASFSGTHTLWVLRLQANNRALPSGPRHQKGSSFDHVCLDLCLDPTSVASSKLSISLFWPSSICSSQNYEYTYLFFNKYLFFFISPSNFQFSAALRNLQSYINIYYIYI